MKEEEYFNKCMAVLEQIEDGAEDACILAWIAKDYLEMLGVAIGAIQPK